MRAFIMSLAKSEMRLATSSALRERHGTLFSPALYFFDFAAAFLASASTSKVAS